MRARRDRPVLGGACLAQVLSVLGAAEVGRDPRVEGLQAAGSRRWGWSNRSLQRALVSLPPMPGVPLPVDDLHLISEPSLSESAPKRGLRGARCPTTSFERRLAKVGNPTCWVDNGSGSVPDPHSPLQRTLVSGAAFASCPFPGPGVSGLPRERELPQRHPPLVIPDAVAWGAQ
jgi:hypothetical protein